MNKRIIAFASLVVVITATIYLSSGCKSTRPTEHPTAAVTIDDGQIRIASFNIQNFGKTKASKPEVMQVLAEIVRKYEVVAVQEVSDKTETVSQKLLELINSSGVSYKLLLSERSGQQSDDKTAQEQYAYYYDSKRVQQLDQAMLFDDSNGDWFQREPFLARFKVLDGNFNFVLVSIHTSPEYAVEEICALDGVISWAQTIYPGEDDFIALGDFNAGCSYASPSKLDLCSIRGSNYVWIVPDDADSNLATKQCAYDRIVGTTGMNSDYAGRWGVDEAFQDKAVSDHWPVWAEFYSNRDDP